MGLGVSAHYTFNGRYQSVVDTQVLETADILKLKSQLVFSPTFLGHSQKLCLWFQFTILASPNNSWKTLEPQSKRFQSIFSQQLRTTQFLRRVRNRHDPRKRPLPLPPEGIHKCHSRLQALLTLSDPIPSHHPTESIEYSKGHQHWLCQLD